VPPVNLINVRSLVEGTVTAVPRGPGDEVAASATIVVVELKASLC
jgi:hypothetical protein